MMFGILSNYLKEIVYQEIPPLLRMINSICLNALRTKLRRKRLRTSLMHQQKQKISCSHIRDLII
ncbi:hypothetical protein AAG906_005302 [Vitis piasezkii]